MEGFLEKYLLQQRERNNKLNIFYATNEKKKRIDIGSLTVAISSHAYIIPITKWLNTVVGSYATNKDA